LDAADLGDLPAVTFRPDPEHPRQQNVALAAPTCAAIAVTELNADRDPDGTHTARLVDGLVEALA
jgi:hypothetical protein